MQVHHFGNIEIDSNTVLTTGIFDGVHLGHAYIFKKILERASKLNYESAVVTYWPHPRTYFSNEPVQLITTLEEKIEIIESFGFDHLIVLPFDETLANMTFQDFTKELIVDKLQAKLWLLGFNHRFGKGREGRYENIKEEAFKYQLHVEQLEPVLNQDEPISSSWVRKLIVEGNVGKIFDLLGRPYSVRGTVIKGDQIGRGIGFPTANMKIDESKLIPKIGAYQVNALYKGEVLHGMMNIGVRPTVANATGQVVSEVHIFNFDQNIYDEELNIQFVRMIRPEMKFKSIDELKKQLTKDRDLCMKNLINRA